MPSGDKSNKRRVSDDDFELSPPQLEPSTKVIKLIKKSCLLLTCVLRRVSFFWHVFSTKPPNGYNVPRC